ncbi:hypothetical protein [Rhizobium sp. 007]|uniref:hypothetical protein n=1 Tax=Rhizobium sp. 007 TaxID=2785056 RepID=UPI00188F7EAD|nr:hypothetical protein [Rhizobium sp. 007]QPB24556.1 hypothetical protein ISN39_34000 [Rhizobium sp. 007]
MDPDHWRQRCEELIRLADNGGLDYKTSHLERERGYRHYDRELRAQQLRDAQQWPELVEKMRADLRPRKSHSPCLSSSGLRSPSKRGSK